MYAAFTDAQANQFIETTQIHWSLVKARAEAAECKGSMHWKSIGGKQYLYWTNSSGNGRSLGRRSEDTEQALEQFARRKRETAERLRSLVDLSDASSRLNAALRLGSLPTLVADAFERLGESGLMGKNLMVIGTSAIHAYASMAGVQFTSNLAATVDTSLLWRHNSGLSLITVHEVIGDELEYVDILKQKDAIEDEPDLMEALTLGARSGRRLDAKSTAFGAKNMEWLLDAPPVDALVIARDGRIVTITVPDPRAFVVFKAWMSNVGDRPHAKRTRDREQASVVVRLIEDHLPHRNRWDALASFPKVVVGTASEIMKRRDWLSPRA